MKNKATLTFILGLVLAVTSVLGCVQLGARQRFVTRGWETGIPEPLGAAGPPQLCVNAALDQYSAADLDWALDSIAAGGYTWVRQRFSWSAIEPQEGEFRWDDFDVLVREATERDLRLLAVLDDAPAWAGSPPDAAAFARFAAALAARYGDTLTHYQIWQNPNLGDSWGGRADAFGYAALLSDAAAAIRVVDADALIVLGGLAPTVEVGEINYAEDLFLEMLVAAGATPYFDIVAVQPYGFDNPPDDRRVSRDVFNFSRAVLVREALLDLGAGDKTVWVTNFGWNNKPADWPGVESIWGAVSADVQASYSGAALARASREWLWMEGLCLNGFQPRWETPGLSVPDAQEHWGFALVSPQGAPRSVYTAVRDWAARPQVATPGVYPAGTELADFEGTWTFGEQGADIGQTGDRVALTFEGTGVALTVRRGPYRAFLFVSVDGEPAAALPRDQEGHAYVVLYDPLAAQATVKLAENLPYGPHTVEVVAERGWDQWALVDWRVLNQADNGAYQLSLAVFAFVGVLGCGLLFSGGRRMDWRRVGRWAHALWERLGEWGQHLLATLLSAVYIFGVWQLMMGQALFRHLGEGADIAVLALAGGLFYFSPWALLTMGAGFGVSLLVFLRPGLGLALTIFAAPLYLHPLSLLGKSFSLAELVLLPSLLGWFVCLIRVRVFGMAVEGKEKIPVPPHDFLFAVLGFVCVAILSTFFAEHRWEALRELRLVVLEPALIFLALASLPLTKRERWHVIDAFVLSSVSVALVGLVQYFLLGDVITAEGGIQRLRSIYGSPNNVGLYLGRVLPLLIAVVLWGPGSPVGEKPSGEGWVHFAVRQVRAFWRSLLASKRRLGYALALLPVSLALLLSLSRGALVLGIPLSLLVIGLLAGKFWRRVTFVALLAGILILIPLLNTPRFAGLLNLQQGTTGFRVSLWHSTLGMIREHPLLGVGLDNFLYAYRTRYVLPTAWQEFNLSHPHNVLMDFTARLGIPGLLAFLWFQVIFWKRTLPLRSHADADVRALALGVMGSMANFLGHGMVDASYFVIDLAYVFFLTLAIACWLSERRDM